VTRRARTGDTTGARTGRPVRIPAAPAGGVRARRDRNLVADLAGAAAAKAG
jgi:hypothetical protein